MKITEERVLDILEDGEPVDRGTWRWGHTETHVFKEGDKNYAFIVRFQPEHGAQDIENGVECWEVEPVEIKKTIWRRVKVQTPVSIAPPTDAI